MRAACGGCAISGAIRSGRDFSAWVGLVLKQNSRGKDKLGSVTRQGNRYLRWLLVCGVMVVHPQKHGTKKHPCLGRLMARRPTKVAAVALANKIPPVGCAIIACGERYREPKLIAGRVASRQIGTPPIGEDMTT
jgi:transposase